MNRSELVELVSEQVGDRRLAATTVEAVLDTVVRAVADGQRVSLSGFGVFERAERAARTARNPATGGSVDVPATVVPRFRPGQGFKDVVSGRRQLPERPAPADPQPRRPARPARSAAEDALPAAGGRAGDDGSDGGQGVGRGSDERPSEVSAPSTGGSRGRTSSSKGGDASGASAGKGGEGKSSKDESSGGKARKDQASKGRSAKDKTSKSKDKAPKSKTSKGKGKAKS